MLFCRASVEPSGARCACGGCGGKLRRWVRYGAKLHNENCGLHKTAYEMHSVPLPERFPFE